MMRALRVKLAAFMPGLGRVCRRQGHKQGMLVELAFGTRRILASTQPL